MYNQTQNTLQIDFTKVKWNSL